MPPLPAASGQATISSFFKPKPTPAAASAAPASTSTQPLRAPASASTSYARTRSLSQDASDRPSKVPRTTLSEKPSAATRDRMHHWRFQPPQFGSSSSAAAELGEDGLSLSQRSGEQERTHAAFRKKLLGDSDLFGRSRDIDLDPIQTGSALGSSEAAGAADKENSTQADRNDLFLGDSNDGPDSDVEVVERPPPATNRFSSFSAQRSQRNEVSQALGTTKGKRKAVETDDGPKYTPLEKQILDLKAKHPGVLLIIEVGYKLKFYGEDARIASKELNIMCFPERNLMTAMIPVHRLHIHVKKLIAAGHKVGVVRQTETRALKAASSNANTPFERKLTALYTASTWVDDLSSKDSISPEALDLGIARPKTLMAIIEKLEGGNGPEDRVSCGIIAVEVSTGSIVYDQFSDGHARSELETRLAHLFPAELLLPAKLSRPSEKMLAYLAGGEAMGKIRIERLNDELGYNEAFQRVTRFYQDENDNGSVEPGLGTSFFEPLPDRGELLSLAVSLPHLALIALASIIQHLEAFGLESICRLSTNFQSFSNRTTMTLNGNTLVNLEIFRNSTDGVREKGSLIWILDRCKTMMGKRLLRKWVARPLTDKVALTRRVDAVQALTEGKHAILRGLPTLLQGLPDLEKGLARMTYGRSTPTELATILLSLNRVTQEYKLVDEPAEMGLGSELLNDAVWDLPRGKAAVQKYLQQISIKEARANNKADLFLDSDQCPELQEAKDNIAIVETELREHLKELRKYLKRPSLEYTTVAGIEYLVEVRVNDAKKVPPEWLRISATKTMVRFHTPTVLTLTKRRDQHRETMEAEAEAAFQRLVRTICNEHYVELRNVVVALATIDALVSLAAVAALPGYCRPQLDEGTEEGNRIEIRGLRHPMIEALREEPYVPNDISLGSPSSHHDECTKAILLTGSNMGGKSSVVRALALCVILAQIGSYIPADSARLSLHDTVLTRMGASDDLAKGRSTFMLELLETNTILRSATSRSLVILDELGRGTSTTDGLAIAHAVLAHFLNLAERSKPNLVFVTHYFQLGEAARTGALRNMHMAFLEVPASTTDRTEDGEEAGDKTIQFLYRLEPGLASRSFGVHCARLAGLPAPVLKRAEEVAVQTERADDERKAAKRMKEREQLVRRVWGHGAVPGREEVDWLKGTLDRWGGKV